MSSHVVSSAVATSSDRRGTARVVGRWMTSFLAFPIGGLIASATVGRVDSVGAALGGGLITGLVLGVGQRLAAGPLRLLAPPWIATTAAATAIGLAAAAAVVDYGTTTGDLAVQGLITGAVLGAAQALLLWSRHRTLAALWAPLVGALWAAGWTVTSSAGVDVERQYTVFGASGALLVALGTSVLPLTLDRQPRR